MSVAAPPGNAGADGGGDQPRDAVECALYASVRAQQRVLDAERTLWNDSPMSRVAEVVEELWVALETLALGLRYTERARRAHAAVCYVERVRTIAAKGAFLDRRGANANNNPETPYAQRLALFEAEQKRILARIVLAYRNPEPGQ